jgi:ankyrin repeat protein
MYCSSYSYIACPYPVDWAVINNQLKVIELLTEAGADCNVANKFGKTPLDDAIESESFELGV